jgi:phospholipid/cholesterol/gamma-HCH transport system substrate-binding protein
MRSRWNLPIYLAYLVICLAVIGFIVVQVGVTVPWSHPYTVTAVFADGADILTNNEVYMDGVKVGHVGSVTVVSGQAHVQLVLDSAGALPLHPNASAEVRKKNLLGETYIDLQPGGGVNLLSDGGIIPVSHTVPITEIDQVLAILDPESVQRVQLLINAAGIATANNGSNMNASVASANQLITALNGPALELSVRQQQVQDIVLELQRLYGVLAGQRAQVLSEFGTWNQVMGQLASQESGIAGTLQQADGLLQNVNTLVSGEGGNIRTVLANVTNALHSTNSFLTQSDAIATALAPYRQYVDDIFPSLHSSFTTLDTNTNHFWTVYSVNCIPTVCTGSHPAISTAASSTDVWTAFGTGGGQ